MTLLWVALLVAQGGAPRKPAAPASGSFDSVLAGKHAVGRSVAIPAILLPPTAVQTTSGGKTRYFVLAVKKDSAYFRGLAEAAQSLREKGPEKLKLLAASTRDDQKYRAIVGELDELLGAAVGAGAKASRLALVEPAEAIAVEVTGLEALASAYNWETVVEKKPSVSPSFALPPTSAPPMPTLPAFLQGWDEMSARLALVNFSQDRPPDLSQKLPDFATQRPFRDAREREAYDASVELFNTELGRRRDYVVQRSEEDFKITLHRLERFLALEEQTLQATVIAQPDLAAEAFRRIHGRAPATFVRERAKPDAAFVRRCFQTASLFLTSYPAGAAVTLDGRDAGVTPLAAPDLPVGTRVKLVATRAGFHPKEAEEAITPQPSGVQRLDLSLEPEAAPSARRMTGEEARQLFAAGFTPAKKFTLAVFATSERPGFKGKKDKDGAKRAEAIRKAAAVASGTTYAGWFEQSASPDTAEVALEIGQPPAGGAKDAKGDRVFKVTYRGGQEEDSVTEVVSLDDERATSDRVLLRLMEQLKHRRWTRALGVE